MMLRPNVFSKTTASLLLLLALFIAPGCESLFLGGSRQDQKIEGLDVTREQLRLTMRSQVHPMTGIIEDTADEIIKDTDNPEIKEAALHWKATALPTVRETLFSPQPLVALFDTWAFSYQMMDYFETGPGKALFKEYAPKGYDAAKEINQRMEEIYASVTTTDEVEEARKLLIEWDKTNTITGDIDNRESIYNQANKISLALGVSFRDSVDEMVTNVDDLNRKLDVYSDQLPEQARWQAEIFAHQALGTLRLDSVVDKLPEFMDKAETTMIQADTTLAAAQTTLDGMPNLLTHQRDALMAQVAEERKIVMSQISNEVDGLQEQLNIVRDQINQHITGEREALQVFISRQRELTMGDIETIRERLINGFFVKMLVLLALTAIFLSILCYLIVKSIKKSIESRPNPAP